MSEEQVNAAEAEAVKEEEEEVVEEISEDDLEGVTGGGGSFTGKDLLRTGGEEPPTVPTCCGHDPCLGRLAGCNSETTAD